MKYKIWNNTDNLVTPIGEILTPAKFKAKYPMAGIPGMNFIVLDSPISMGVFMEFEQTKATYKKMIVDMAKLPEMSKLELTKIESEYDTQTDKEILELISYFDDNQPEPESTAEERIAAALEFQNLLALPDVEV